VSAETATAMATGVRERFHAQVSVAVTGIAGPTGGTPQKPVGTVFIAVAGPQGVEARRFAFQGGREEIKAQTAEAALTWLVEELAS
jgi:nicotinamide-nucleotide amidase